MVALPELALVTGMQPAAEVGIDDGILDDRAAIVVAAVDSYFVIPHLPPDEIWDGRGGAIVVVDVVATVVVDS